MIKPEIRQSIFLVGQTASGKTAVGLRLAELIGAEILSLDSMTLWREMDIGTAKPTLAERARVPHHLIDVVDPSEWFNVGQYVALATQAAREIIGRGRVPLFVGGTGLYLKMLITGLFQGPSADWELRNRLKRIAAEQGTAHLHEQLKAVDPAAANRIHPNDLRRIVRALEVHEKTGRPISELQREWSQAQAEQSPPIFGLSRSRLDLHFRIDRRFDQMMADGFLDEVRRLAARPAGLGRAASQALGYKELLAHVRGEISLDEAVDLIKRNTRHFAKRQMTWFRAFPQIVWIDVAPNDDPGTTAELTRQKIA
ncbi:MAG TPA: tRNA (adenosine(37)-N6)-dimethylallyltransferase MiaA [Planctomycetota bacterium]|nr:tRNA (adenosine(37)-N6)-dimethylallyltransferase MiaA [Planctomycetota bacterium]